MKDKYRVFCEKYPEYCSERLFERLFSSIRTLSDLLKTSDGTLMKIRAVIASVEKRTAKSGRQYYILELCDKEVCNSGVYFGDKELRKGDDIIAKAKMLTWKGNRDVIVEDFEVLGNIYEVVGDNNEIPEVRENSNTENHNGRSVNGGEEKAVVRDNPVEKFRNILSEALGRGVKVKLDKAQALARKLGLKWEDVEHIVEVYEEQSPNSLEKIKYVRLREANTNGS